MQQAFHRRREKDEAGLSVFFGLPPEDCFRDFDAEAVVSLHVGSVRDLGLTLEVDAPNHANLVGLPYEKDVYDVHGMRRASRLADHARFVLSPKQKRAARVWEQFRTEFASEPIWVGLSPDATTWQARMRDGTLRIFPVMSTDP